MTKPVRLAVILGFLALVAWFFWDAFSQPGVQDLRGGFEEVAFYRNENNTGPIQRIYAITVAEPENAEMEAYGYYMPYTKYGTTKVYFFKKGSPVPKVLVPGEHNFPESFQPYVLAIYEKDAMSQVSFRKF